jgi:small subunit ribosomal protein S6
MSCYEAVFIIGQDLTVKNVNDIVDGFAQYVEKNNGKLIKNEYWGLRSLAYPIAKAKKAHYVMLGLECSGEVMNDLIKKANIREDLLRFVPIKVSAISKEPSAIMPQDEPKVTREPTKRESANA